MPIKRVQWQCTHLPILEEELFDNLKGQGREATEGASHQRPGELILQSSTVSFSHILLMVCSLEGLC
jgi:hypothetical protein